MSTIEYHLKTLAAAVSEARRFIRKAEEAQDDLKRKGHHHNGRKMAAAKRSSMDLSNALVQVRKSPYSQTTP